jgi:hypothetical protein
MSQTPSEDEAASAGPVSETPSEDDAALDNDRGGQPQRCARLEALEACTVELLRRFDESKCNMDRYYHAFLELETVVNQLAENQNRITEFVQNVPGAGAAGAGAAGAGPSGAPAGAGAAGGEAREPAARNAKWRGIACPHGRRRYRCRHCAGGGAGGGAASTARAPRGGLDGLGGLGEPAARAAAHAQLAGDLRSLKARIAQITRPGARHAARGVAPPET